MPLPPNDLDVDPDDDQEMGDVEDQANADKPSPHGALVPPFVRRRPDSRLRMELGDQLCALFLEVGVRPTTMREIQVDARLVQMWRGMLRDMFTLMRNVIEATSLVT